MAKATATTAAFPYTGLPRFLLSPNTQIKVMFHTENAGLPSKSAVFALRPYASLVVGGFQGGHRRANLLMAAVPVLCLRCAEMPAKCGQPSGDHQ